MFPVHTVPGMSDCESYVSASDDELVPKKGSTSTASNKSRYFEKYERKLFSLKVKTTNEVRRAAGDVRLKCKQVTPPRVLAPYNRKSKGWLEITDAVMWWKSET